MERLRIYVAGPYTPYYESPYDTLRVVQRNIDRAMEIANAIHGKGHYAFVPHLTHYIHIHYSCLADKGYDWYCDYGNTFLDEWATGLYFIKPSPGTDKEVKRAIKRRIPIFYSLDEIPLININIH